MNKKTKKTKTGAKTARTKDATKPAATSPAVAATTWRPNWKLRDESSMPTPEGLWPVESAPLFEGSDGRQYPVRQLGYPPFPDGSTASETADALRSPFVGYARQVLADCGFESNDFEETAALLVSWRLRYPLALDCNMFEAEMIAIPPPTSAGMEAAAEFAAFKLGTRSWWRRWELVGRCVALYCATARAARRGLTGKRMQAVVDRCADDFRRVREAVRAARSAKWGEDIFETVRPCDKFEKPLSPEWIENGFIGGPIHYKILFMAARKFGALHGSPIDEAAPERQDEAERALSSAFADAVERFARLLTAEVGAPADAPPASPSNPATAGADKPADGAPAPPSNPATASADKSADGAKRKKTPAQLAADALKWKFREAVKTWVARHEEHRRRNRIRRESPGEKWAKFQAWVSSAGSGFKDVADMVDRGLFDEAQFHSLRDSVRHD